MIWPFRKKIKNEHHLYAIYNSIVAQSRQEEFYKNMQVTDSVTGRFDMISLHMILVLRRLRSENAEIKEFSQNLFDLFFKDMDNSIREMGVSDIAVPKKIQKMGSLFYGFLGKLTNSLDNNDEKELVIVVNNNIYDGKDRKNAEKLSKYISETVKLLNKQNLEDIILGKISFIKFGK